MQTRWILLNTHIKDDIHVDPSQSTSPHLVLLPISETHPKMHLGAISWPASLDGHIVGAGFQVVEMLLRYPHTYVPSPEKLQGWGLWNMVPVKETLGTLIGQHSGLTTTKYAPRIQTLLWTISRKVKNAFACAIMQSSWHMCKYLYIILDGLLVATGTSFDPMQWCSHH